MWLKVYYGKRFIDVEVSEEFAVAYSDMEHREYLVERKETRRHQSLEKSMQNGFDFADLKANVAEEAERNELKETLHKALNKLTDKQRTVIIMYAINGMSFRKIGEKIGISKDTAQEHFQSAVKKMKKFLKDTPSK
jgi:RNA polymerase sigma factor (sigma-70 family)